MKLASVVVCALGSATAAPAHADPAADVAAVAKQLWVGAFSFDDAKFVAAFRAGSTFYGNGVVTAIATTPRCVGVGSVSCGQQLQTELWGNLNGFLSAKAVADPAVVVDAADQVAWSLQTIAVTRHHDSGPVLAEPCQARVLAIVDGAAGWKVGSASFIGLVSDADLGAHGKTWTPRPGSHPSFADGKLIKWIEGGQLAAHMTKGTQVLVSGTSDAELATDAAAAAKIVKTWDQLHMKADPFMAVDYFGAANTIAWVNGSVGLPGKGRLLGLHVTAILQKGKSDDDWTWLALAFSPVSIY